MKTLLSSQILETESPTGQKEFRWLTRTHDGSTPVREDVHVCRRRGSGCVPLLSRVQGKGKGVSLLTQPRDPKMVSEIMYLKALCKV